MGTGSTSRNYPTRRCYLVILQHPQRTSRCLTGPRGRKFIRPLKEQTALKGAGTRAVWEAMTVKVRCSLEWRGGLPNRTGPEGGSLRPYFVLPR